MKAIRNARAVLPDGVMENAVILIENGKIINVGEAMEIPAGAEIIDAEGMVVGPGFVDEHCHAGGDYWAYDDPVKMAEHHLRGGTTSVLCTIYHNIGVDGAIRAMDKVRAAMAENKPGNITGLFFEGPSLNPKYGCYLDKVRPVDPKEYTYYLENYRDIIKLWMVAPEMAGAMEFIDAARSAGIPIAIGHSEASVECVTEAVKRGATICTHIYDATGTAVEPTRYGGTKEVSFDIACMLQKELFCEIIHDKAGVHVRHDMIRFILQAVGIDRVVAITDACTGSLDDSDINILDGDLNGSKLRMNRVARNFRDNIGMSLPDIFRICSLNPARALHMEDAVGSVEVGKRANLVILNENFDVRRVLLDGETVVKEDVV